MKAKKKLFKAKAPKLSFAMPEDKLADKMPKMPKIAKPKKMKTPKKI